MKRTIKLAAAAVIALGSVPASATNGDHLIGLGAKARGMAGVGIGIRHGAESGIINPALISGVQDVEVSFGGTLFMPDVSYDAHMGAGLQKSEADLSMIPEVSIAYKVNEHFYWGIGMWGTAGMGVDYRNAGDPDTSGSGTMQMVTNLQLIQFGVPLTYAHSGVSIGVTPVLQYGALDINYKLPNVVGSHNTFGSGVAQDLAFGYALGAAYVFGAGLTGVTIGAVYKSAIEMEYDGQLSTTTAPFVTYNILPAPMEDKLQQPSEIGIGLSYRLAGHTVAFDYRRIMWGSAKGYDAFNWSDQEVFALGYEYTADAFALRLGYSYAKQPIQEQQDGTGIVDKMDPNTYPYASGATLNMSNLLGFPATVEQHFGIGGTYAVANNMTVDAALTYAPETETTFGTHALAVFGIAGESATVAHSQTALTFQLNFFF